MAKILEVGDMIYNHKITPTIRYLVEAVTSKMCTLVDSRTNEKYKCVREPDKFGFYKIHNVGHWGFWGDVDAEKYYQETISKEKERNRIAKMQNQMYNIKWREVPAEKLEAIIKIL
jgi:hypothetical protein